MMNLLVCHWNYRGECGKCYYLSPSPAVLCGTKVDLFVQTVNTTLFLDLIPVLSFIFLGAKCRYCKKPIPWRYFIVEMLSGLIFLNFGFLGFMYWMMLIIAFMDWETMLVSDWLVIIWAILVVLNGGTSILGGLVGLGIIGIIWALTRGKAMGAGRYRNRRSFRPLARFPKNNYRSVVCVCYWRNIWGLFITHKKAGMKSQIPFGPFLLIGGLIAYTYCYGFLCF